MTKKLYPLFEQAYAELADLAKADSPGGCEYTRVKALWLESNRPFEHDLDQLKQFIYENANIGPDGKKASCRWNWDAE